MEKRGVSNIEMVISFLMFIGFTFAALLLFNPTSSNDRMVDSSLNYAINAIVQNASIDIISYSVKLTAPDDAKTVNVSFLE